MLFNLALEKITRTPRAKGEVVEMNYKMLGIPDDIVILESNLEVIERLTKSLEIKYST